MKVKQVSSQFILAYDGEADYQYHDRTGLNHRYSVRFMESKCQAPGYGGSRHLVGCIIWTDDREPPAETLESLHPGYVVAWLKPTGTTRDVHVLGGTIEVKNREWFFFGVPDTVERCDGTLVSLARARDLVAANVYKKADFVGEMAHKI